MLKVLKRLLQRLKYIKIIVLSYFRRLRMDYKIRTGKLPCLKCISKSPLYIVSLTSYGKRVNNMVHYTITSILLQSDKPDKIVLYLDNQNWSEDNLPNNLKFLKRHGLEVHFCKDVRSYTKLVYAIQEFPNDILVTADDDIFYPRNWLRKLKECYSSNPDNICCHRAHEICLDEQNCIKPYKRWKYEIKKMDNHKLIFPTGVGGVLYPPNALYSSATDSNLFLDFAPTADDLWLWAMAKLQGTKVCLVNNPIRQFLSVNQKEEWSMCLANLNVAGNENDKQLKNILEKFPEIMLALKEK